MIVRALLLLLLGLAFDQIVWQVVKHTIAPTGGTGLVLAVSVGIVCGLLPVLVFARWLRND